MHKLFYISVLLKGLNGLLEVLVGLLAVFISKTTLMSLVEMVARRELIEDPGDVVATYLVTSIQSYTLNMQVFISLYLLIHGVLKVWLVISLLQRRLWAYPTAIVVFSLFIVYQVYEYIRNPGIALVVLSIIDLLVIFLTYYEYRSIRTHGWHKKMPPTQQ